MASVPRQSRVHGPVGVRLCTAGGSLAGAQALLAGDARRVFHVGGGLHHAMHGRASGFCYVNDVVLAIQRMVEQGSGSSYLDIDAHTATACKRPSTTPSTS